MPGTNLTRDEAAARARILDVGSYEVSLDLTTGPTTFGTTTTVRFGCTEPGAHTFIDLIAESVESVTLNGTALDPASVFADSRIALSGLQAENELTVEATGRYTNTGEGLHRFVDPVDGEVYLYTQFEVPDSRRMYTVFEQPDLKASFRFTVTAPAHWKIISNSPTPQSVPAGVADGVERATWDFAPTKRISSYITALIAGPYDEVRDEVQTRGGVVPLGVFCRRSLTQHLDADAIFDCTKKGFGFFEAEFDQPYPFEKYDQVFTPEYNMGAMENAGAVTFTEVYVFRSKVSEAKIERRALTILHELAHMWFGNLVTMRWWDDLWLNESFAEWASTTCQAEATEWTSAWTTFGTSEKAWAYTQDQLSSTHPIAADMRHLEDVEVNFDGITYAKGASVLKQLVAYVGREPFVAALRQYFRTHAWGNTTLADLLGELETASGRQLGEWSRLWLETAGVNTLRPVFEVGDDGRYTRFAVEQSAAEEYPTLRPHRLGIGRYAVRAAESADGAAVLERVGYDEVDVDGASTELEALVGQEQPDLLLLNDADLAYAKIRLDERSLATALAHPRGFTDSLPRSLVLGATWDMTRDAEMAARDFVRFVLETLPGESDSTLLRVLIGQLSTAARLYTAPEHRAATGELLTSSLHDLAVAAEPGSDAQFQLVEAWAASAARESDAPALRALLTGADTLEGLTIDTELRWTLVKALAAVGAADDAEIQAELDRDPTSTGRERAAEARAARPTAEAKEQAWAEAVEQNTLPNQMVEAVSAGFRRSTDPSLLRPYVERYHAVAEEAWAARSVAIGERVVGGFYPFSLADRSLADASQAWLDAHPDAAPGLVRTIAENRDTVVRALAAQERDARGD
ncbi:aminopeptidase N [Terracoccus luteus]|uniref:Aminopeptidase N n=1 Tax=Terracoccus luteus TaxID=53356 RepID=A0A839PY96_9MICO|nr:aminopeptidase N [Terracoccus luteus]MBB2986995.1 aminopeptidase N [Terracoccus luteus]MCP2172646.1 aminopeptidase N [Terracoccus luteus]